MFEEIRKNKSKIIISHNPYLADILVVPELDLTILVGKSDTCIGSGQIGGS